MTICLSDRLDIVIPIEPQGKARPRFDSRSRRTYTPTKTIKYEWEIQKAFRESYPDMIPPSGDLNVQIIACFSMPKSWSKKKKQEALLGHCRKKPDADNIAKAILDALNGLAYVDDAQVVELSVVKYWANEPSVTVTITRATLAI